MKAEGKRDTCCSFPVAHVSHFLLFCVSVSCVHLYNNCARYMVFYCIDNALCV